MRVLGDGRYQCVSCGTVFEVQGEHTPPQTAIVARSGKPSERIITVDGVEVHRCALAR